MLTALPHRFLQRVARQQLGLELPQPGRYAAGIVFLPQDPQQREECRATVQQFIAEQGQICLGWRPLPVDFDAADIGRSARAAPAMEMLFIAAAEGLDQEAFERQLFIIRKLSSHRLRNSSMSQRCCSTSARSQPS